MRVTSLLLVSLVLTAGQQPLAESIVTIDLPLTRTELRPPVTLQRALRIADRYIKAKRIDM